MNNKIVNHSHKRMMSGFCSTALIACFVLGGSVAFAQTSCRVTDLGLLPSKEESVPAAINGGINSSDRIVGYTYFPAINANTDPAVQPGTSPVRQVAFVWSQGAMTDLDKLIGAATDTYHLNSAMAINDNGQIVATALSKSWNTPCCSIDADQSGAVFLTKIYNTGSKPSAGERSRSSCGAKQRQQSDPDKSYSGLTFKR
jgi:hypothetical protein